MLQLALDLSHVEILDINTNAGVYFAPIYYLQDGSPFGVCTGPFHCGTGTVRMACQDQHRGQRQQDTTHQG